MSGQSPSLPAEPAAPLGRIRRLARFGKRLGPTGVMALVATVLPPIGALVLLGFIQTLAPLVRHTAWGPPVCVVLFALLGGFAVLPTAALSIFAGWAFGFPIGYVTALTGFAGATAIAFAVAHRASGRRVMDLVEEDRRWRAVHRALLHSGWRRTFLIVFLLRVPTVPPLAMTTVVLAAARVRWWPFFLGTVLGIAPRTAAYVYFAARAQQLDFHSGENVWLLVSSGVALVAAVAVLTYIARRALAKLTEGETA